MILFHKDIFLSNIRLNKGVDDCLAGLKFLPDWIVTNKMI